MATNDRVELIAAIYDEGTSKRPNIHIFRGSIGKSYAF